MLDDDAQGRSEPGGWYHWHATAIEVNAILDADDVDAECVNVMQNQTAQFGIAFDGCAVFGPLNFGGSIPEDLDACSGNIGLTEEGGERVYHYHSIATFSDLPG